MQAAAESSSLIGFALEDRYRILREIGRGGMGVVFEAEHVELGKRVAVKVVLEKYANDDEALTRFKREALAASRIGNPHIIDVSHIGIAPDGRPFVVMELLTGEPLSKILQATGPMPPWRAIQIMRQVLRAVGAAHAKGIIHRDLKPDNIFLVNHDDQHDFVKLLDFGISKIIETPEQIAVTSLTTTGMVMGTPLYMAPEQAMGSPVDQGVDIYSCGVILFEMLTGRPVFDETNYNLLVAKLITASPPHITDLRKNLPPKLVTAVHRALEKDPADRFTTAEAFAQALPTDRASSQVELELAGTLGPGASVPAAPVTLQKPRVRRWLWVAGGIAVVAAAAIVVVVVAANSSPEPATTAKSTSSPAPVSVAPPPPPAGSAVTPTPTAELVSLEIRTIPTGASVRVDGNDAGTAPIVISVTTGHHRLHVELAGFRVVDEDQEIHAGERTSAVITLQPASKPMTTTRPVVTSTRPIVKPKPADPQPVSPYGPPHDVPVKPPPPTGTTNDKPNPY